MSLPNIQGALSFSMNSSVDRKNGASNIVLPTTSGLE